MDLLGVCTKSRHANQGLNPFVLFNTLFDVFDMFLAVEFAAVTNVYMQYGTCTEARTCRRIMQLSLILNLQNISIRSWDYWDCGVRHRTHFVQK